jgi:energy-coupling factor transporter ATP-binding protein EcfA2
VELLTQRMREEVLEIQGFLRGGAFLGLAPEDRQGLLESSEKLLERLNAVSDQVLVAGLLGGTGVGKSTVMNALAGADIASTSHRRPHTDRVLLYRHEGTEPPPSLPKTAVPWQEVVHQAEAVRQIVLCDLPDFDSLVGEHLDRVLGFLEHLDVLVFVTSLEKYADDSLYAFLAAVPKARPNFYFVLNKADLLFRGESLEPGYRELTSLTSLFQGYLQKAGIPDPLVYPVSAEKAFQEPSAVSPWNQFPAFRREIFRDREAKEVMAVKSANLDQEIQDLLTRLRTELVYVEALGRIVDDFVKSFDAERGEWEEAGRDTLDAWVEGEIRGHVLGRLETLAPLVGPGYAIGRIAQEWRALRQEKGKGPGEPSAEAAFEPPGALRDHLERVENRILHKSLQQSLPAPYRDRLQGTLDLGEGWEAFSARWRQEIEVRLTGRRAPLFLGFRVFQYTTYLALLVLLLVALTDEEAGRWFFREPGFASFSQVFFSIVRKLFSMTGLGAVLTFGLIQVFLGACFYRRYRARLEKRARTCLESLKSGLSRIWSGELDRVAKSLEDCKLELASQREALTKHLSRQ